MITLIATVFLATVAAAKEPLAANPPAAAANASDFIYTRCESTQYPDVCVQSLSSYGSAVQQDPARLALVAIGVSLSHATSVSAYLANLTHQPQSSSSNVAAGGGDPRAVAAVRDCYSVFGDAMDQMRGSLKQMRGLAPVVGEELKFQISNVQTWMSAALTNEETCTDGFEGVTDGPMKADVCNRTVRVKQFTSNALALVNSYSASNS